MAGSVACSGYTGSPALLSCCELHSFTDSKAGELKVSSSRFFLSLFTLSLSQGMSRWAGLAHAFAEPDVSTKRPFTWRGTFPHANVQNTYSLLFTKQNRFCLINSVQYFGTGPKARRRKRSMQTALQTLARNLEKSKTASIQSAFPK